MPTLHRNKIKTATIANALFGINKAIVAFSKKINKYITNNSSYKMILVFLVIIFVILIILIITGTTTIESMTINNKDNNKKNNSKSNNNESIEIDGVTREYLLININPNDVSNIKNVLLCFPGGGETNTEFVDYTEFNNIDSPVIVFLGQTTINTYSWQNAFPWLYNNFNQNGVTLSYQNDVTFVDTVLSNLFGNTIPELFLTGKSDGGGFCMLYSNISKYKQNIKAIGICSSAHFYVKSDENIDTFDINNEDTYFKGTNDTIIPKGNVLLPPNISLFIMHGTGDTVMPYKGENYKNKKADVNGSLWSVIDPTVKNNKGGITDNTYTVNFPDYIQEIVNKNNLNLKYIYSNTKYSYLVYSSNSNQVLNFITINNQNHDWSGHYNSGPNSNEPSNFTMDATYLLTKFFNLSIGKYSPKVKTIPPTLLTYNNELII